MRERHMKTATIEVLREQIEVFRSRIEEHDTGHLYTTISTLEHRIEELEKEHKDTINKGYMLISLGRKNSHFKFRSFKHLKMIAYFL